MKRFRYWATVEGTQAVLHALLPRALSSNGSREACGKTIDVDSVSVSSVWRGFSLKVLRRKFVRDVGVLTAANFIAASLSFVQGILIARWLGPELYGVAVLIMSYPTLAYTIFNARSFETSVKFLGEFHAQAERDRALAMCKLGYTVDLSIATLTFLAVVLTANWAAYWIAHRPDTVTLIILYSAAFIPQALVGTSYAVLAALGRFSVIACVDMLTISLRVVLVICLVLGRWEVAGVVWGNVIGIMITGVIYGLIAHIVIYRTWGAFPLRANWQTLKGKRREIFGFLAYNDLNIILGMIPKQLDVLLLAYFHNPLEAGYYKLAKSVSSVVSYLVGPLQSVTYPEFVRLSGVEDMQALRQKVYRLALHVGFPLGLVVLASVSFVPFALPALVGDSYFPAVTVAQILLISTAVWLAFFWLRPLYLAQGEVRFWLLDAAGVAALSLIGFVTVAPTWGSVGVAWVGLIISGLGGHLCAVAYLLYLYGAKANHTSARTR